MCDRQRESERERERRSNQNKCMSGYTREDEERRLAVRCIKGMCAGAEVEI